MKELKLNPGEETFLAVLFHNSKKPLTKEYIEKEAVYWKIENYQELIKSFLEKSLLEEKNNGLIFTETGLKEGEKCFTEFQKNNFDENFLIHYKSRTYRKFCKEVYDIEIFLYSMINKLQIEKLEEAADFKNTDKVLDIGCGPGELLEYLYDKYKFIAAGLDFAPKTIALANERVKDKSGIKYLEMNINNLDKLDEKYNKIISVDSLYFHGDVKKSIEDIFNLLEDKGKAFIFYTNLLDHDKKSLYKILDSLKLNYSKIDFTQEEKNHWIKTISTAEKYKQDFEKENSQSIYEERISEANDVMKREYERFLYIIEK